MRYRVKSKDYKDDLGISEKDHSMKKDIETMKKNQFEISNTISPYLTSRIHWNE